MKFHCMWMPCVPTEREWAKYAQSGSTSLSLVGFRPFYL